MARTGSSGGVGDARRWAVIAAIAAFVLVDVALVALALNNASAPVSPGSSRSADYWSESWGEVPPSASPSASEAGPVAVPAVAPTRILGAVNADVAWRATTGSCPDASATPEVSTDGGASWRTTDASGPTGVTALQFVDAASESLASFVGLSGDDCAPQYVRTFVGGDNYATYDEELADEWYLTAEGAINAPGGEDVAAPCESVVAVSARGADAAAALCGDSSVHLTGDRGASWTPTAPLGSPVAITGTDGGYLVAVAGAVECAGVQVVSVDDAGQPASRGCLTLEVDPSALAGAVAMSSAGGTLWLWAGDSVMRSADAGATWL